MTNKTYVFHVIDETAFISCHKPRLYELINIQGFQKSNPKTSEVIPIAKSVIARFNDCHCSHLCNNLLGSIKKYVHNMIFALYSFNLRNNFIYHKPQTQFNKYYIYHLKGIHYFCCWWCLFFF